MLATPCLKHFCECGTACTSVCCSIPGSDHHIDEEWQQVIHAPEEVAIKHGIDFLGQLLKRLLDDDQLV